MHGWLLFSFSFSNNKKVLPCIHHYRTLCVSQTITPPPVLPLSPPGTQINIPRADFDEVGLQLCGKAGGGDEESPASEEGEGEEGTLLDISVVTHSASQNILLFAKSEFLASLADGEE